MKSMKIRLSIVIIGVLIGVTLSWAAIGSWHNYTYSDDSRAIISDDTNIWCATTGGLIRYNYRSGEIAKLLNSDGLGDISLLSLEVDTAGNVYVGGENATLTEIGADGNVQVRRFIGPNSIVYPILDLDADGEIIWVGTGVGVAKYLIYSADGGEFQEVYVNLGDSIPSEIPVRAVLAIDNYLWAGTDSGLAYIEKDNPLPQNPSNWATITRDQNGLANPNITSLILAGDTLMAGTSGGVFYMDSDSIWHNIGPGSERIYDLQYPNGVLVAATNSGIYRRINGNWQLMPENGLLTNDGRGVVADNDGNIWAAFVKGAFGKFDSDGSVWNIHSVPGPPSNRIQEIAIDSSKAIWMVHAIPGFRSPEGITRFDGANWQNYTTENSGIGSNGAVTVEYDNFHNLVWFGSWGDGLFSFDGDSTWVNYDETNSALSGIEDYPYYVPIPSVDIDYAGNIWALNLGGYNPNVVMAAFNPDDSVWQAYYENAQQISDNFQHVIYTHGDTVYVCGELPNIHRLEYGIATDTSDDNWLGLITGVEQIRQLLIDNYGKLFIVSGSGLAYYDFLTRDTVAVELPDGYRSAANCIAMDGLGNKWVGTDSGVVVLASKVEPFNANYISAFKKSNSFLLDNSVISIEVDKSSGLVYIGTTKGLSVYESGIVEPSPDLQDMAVYPNPVDAKSSDARISFLRVPADAEISIYSVSGDLIRRFSYEEINYWDLRNEDGQKVAAGIYLFYVRSGSNSGSGKFAVIR